MGIRSFLAFELPVDLTQAVSQVYQEMRKSPLNVRWVQPEKIHLTLVFMGNVDIGHVEQIGMAAEQVCRQYGAFNVFAKGAGVFGSRRNPRVLWIGLDGELERMSRFRDDLQKSLLPFGIKTENRPFKPHLTLGRFRKGAGSGTKLLELLSRYQDLKSPTCAVEELVLFKSDLTPTGAVYTKLNTWPLNGTR